MLLAPWLVIALMLVLTGISLTYSIKNIGINTDTNDLLSSDLPFRKTYDKYKREFPQFVDTMLFVVEGPTLEITRTVAAELTERLKHSTREFKSVYTPDAEPFFERNGLLYQTVPELEALSDRLATIQPFLATLAENQSLQALLDILSKALDAIDQSEQIDLQPILMRLDEAIQARLMDKPYSLSWQEMMLGETSQQTGSQRQYVVVQPVLNYSDWLPSEQAMRSAREITGSFTGEQYAGVRIRLTGGVALDYEELQSVSRGAGAAAVIATVMVLVLLLVGLRSVWLVVGVLASLFVGLSLTAGFATWAVGELNMISVAFAVLYIGLGVDFAIHYCLHYRHFLYQKTEKMEALRLTGGYVGTALILCAITTAVGFFAFIPTAYSGVSELGLISGTGMFISLFVSLSFLPALLSLRSIPSAHVEHASGKRVGMPEVITQAPYRHAIWIRSGAVIAGLAGVILLPGASFDYNPLNLRDPDSESVSTFRELLADSISSPWNITILANNTQATERMTEELRQLEVVGKVVTLKDLVPSEQEEKLILIEDMALILGLQPETPDADNDTSNADAQTQVDALTRFRDRLMTYLETQKPAEVHATAAQLYSDLNRLLGQLQTSDDARQSRILEDLRTSLLGTLPDNIDRLRESLSASPFAITQLPEAVTSRWVAGDGEQRIQVFPSQDLNDNKALREFVEQVSAIAPNATDFPILSLESGKAVVKAFQQAFISALIVISLILLIIMRNPVDVIYLLIPLLLAGLLTVATVIIFDMRFNFANIIALPLLLGIGVDNGIHMIWRVRRGIKAKHNLLTTSTTRAVIVSALTTVVSFGNLSFSMHPGTASMGKLLTIGMIFTLITTLIVLPALLSIRYSSTEDMREIG